MICAEKFETDKNGVSHTTYNLEAGIERIVFGLMDIVETMIEYRPMLIKRPVLIGKRNRKEWCIYSTNVLEGERDGKRVGGFNLRVEVSDFGSECPPALGWRTFPDRFLHVFKRVLPLERIILISCYTKEGFYIGDLRDAILACGIFDLEDVQPWSVADGRESASKAKREKTTCSIGYNRQEQTWFGWSHRAIKGFKVGEPVHTNSIVKYGFLPYHKVETEEESKQCAIAFARSVT